MGVFEIRLATGKHPVDFSVRLANFEQARQVASKIEPPHLKELLTHGWQELGHPSPISSLWLEFDLDGDLEDLDALPIPIVCAKLTEAPDPEWLIERLLPALHGRSLEQTQLQLIRHCLNEIPGGWRVLYAFSLRPRHESAVRLELYGEDASCMGPYLRRIDLGRSADHIETLLSLFETSDRYHLSFDVSEEISPEIGVEYAFQRLPRREPRWAEQLSRLVTAGFCDAEKRGAILKWPGYDSIWTMPKNWLEATKGYCARGLSHLKLSPLRKEPQKSKVYFSFEAIRPNPGCTPDSSHA